MDRFRCAKHRLCAKDDFASRWKIYFDASNDDDTGRSTMNMQLEDFYNGAIDADYLIYNSAIDGGVKNLNELLDKCPVLADLGSQRRQCILHHERYVSAVYVHRIYD